jgi:protoporphyrin/coproporphyrin ferrochelatase
MSIGVLTMAYGTPRDRDDVEAYYTDIRRGRPPAPEALADLVRRYDAIGGTFPLRELTDRQVAAVRAELDRKQPGEFVVALGTKHSQPSIADAVAELAGRGVQRIVGLVLAPHYSAMSVGAYADAARAAATRHGIHVDVVKEWHLLPAYVDFLAKAVRDALAQLPADSEAVFTAHSLPRRILDTGDPYPMQLRETAQAIADAAGLTHWSVGWQSAGRTAEPWLGPDVLDIIRDRADQSAGLVVSACGFVSDHLEVAYDLDIEATALARSVGLPFARTASVNDDPAVMTALADLVAHS